MKNKKYTQLQRIGRLENVVTQLFLTNKMITDEIKALQEKINSKESVESVNLVRNITVNSPEHVNSSSIPGTGDNGPTISKTNSKKKSDKKN